MPSNRKTGSETTITDLHARNLLATDSTDPPGLKAFVGSKPLWALPLLLERVNRIHADYNTDYNADYNADDRAANHGTNHGRRLCR